MTYSIAGFLSQRRGAVVLLWLVVGSVDVVPALGQDRVLADDPYRFVQWTIQDGRGLWRGVRSRRALYAGAGLAGIVLSLSWQDSELTQGAVDLAGDTYPPVRRLANELGNVKLVQPGSLMLFLGSLLSDDTHFQDAAFTSFEAIVFANLITDILKGTVGRARPYEGKGSHHFRPFSGSRSFPSGHATTVFAFTTPWLLYYTNYSTGIVFAMGAGTAFTRMADNQHWFTDVLAGTAIGFTTAYWLTQRHRRSTSGDVSVVPVVAAHGTGAGVQVRF